MVEDVFFSKEGRKRLESIYFLISHLMKTSLIIAKSGLERQRLGRWISVDFTLKKSDSKMINMET